MPYHIVTTLGPSTAEAKLWQDLVDAGAHAFRLNTSHLSLSTLDIWLEKLERFNSQRAKAIPIVLDLQGSKWRLGRFHAFTLSKNQRITLCLAESADDEAVLPVPHPDFFQAAQQAAAEIVLNDAKIRLSIESVAGEVITCQVLLAGEISSHKGIALPGTAFRRESLPLKDLSIVKKCESLPNIRYALSYVKDSIEMAHYRRQLGPDAYLIAKLERQTALADSQSMHSACQEMWVCRGDLGAELGLAALAQAVYTFHSQVKAVPIPVYMAGQVLEHMTDNGQPTRSEICHLYELLQKGYSGVVLSDETAIGRFPVEACRTAALFNQSKD
jgi:pyruvate kinase